MEMHELVDLLLSMGHKESRKMTLYDENSKDYIEASASLDTINLILSFLNKKLGQKGEKNEGI